MSDVPVIEARGIRKSYHTGSVSTPVLHGIDLTVRHGECVFLMGPSGSGKSTLMSIVGCVLSPDEGELRLLGEDVTRLRARSLARFRLNRIGFVFQRFHLFSGLRAWENVRIVFDLLGRSKREGRRESHRLLDMVGLSDRSNHRIRELSMGQRQRVAVARALAADPDLILADEPTASLDAASGQNAMRILKDLCEDLGKTAVVVTHDSRIVHMASRILHLSDGVIGRETEQSPRTEENERSAPGAA